MKIKAQTMLQDFIKESLKNRKVPYKWIRIGTIENNAQKRIEEKYGYKVSEIHIDNSGIIHTMAQAHHNTAVCWYSTHGVQKRLGETPMLPS